MDIRNNKLFVVGLRFTGLNQMKNLTEIQELDSYERDFNECNPVRFQTCHKYTCRAVS